MADDEDQVLLTAGDVRRWMNERDAAKAELARWQAVVSKLEDRLALVESILGPASAAKILGPYSSPPESFTAWVRKAVRDAGEWITLKELGKAAEESEFSEQHKRNSNGLYNIVSRAVDKRDFVRHGPNIIDAAIFEQITESGEDPYANLDTTPDYPSTTQEIMRILEKKPEGLKAGQIVDILKSIPYVSDRLASNPQYPYSVLARMLKRGQVARYQDTYLSPESPFA